MEENLEQAHDARLMDFEAGIADGADSDRVGKALEEGKSTWLLSHSAWKPAKRSVIAWKVARTASRWSSPFLRPKSLRLFETSSLRRNVENFSSCFRKALLKWARKA